VSEAALLTRARRQAGSLYRSPGFQSAYVAGARARLNGRPPESCPYARDPQKTWRSGFRKAWLSGYASVG
jgi:ribosome modulation factor